MILLIDDYSSKYWLNDEIKDCAINSSNNEDFILDINIVTEKLKDNTNNIIINNKLNGKYQSRNIKSSSGNRNEENSKSIIRSDLYKYQNKNNKPIDRQKTNTHFNLHRTNHTNNNQKKLFKLPPSSRISEHKRRNVLLDSYSKYTIKNNSFS